MDLNGLWTAEFSTGLAAGTGVVIIIDGTILGGDANYFYSGTFAELAGTMKGNLHVEHFSGPLTNVFGPLRSIDLKLEGAAGGDLIRAQGYLPSRPSQRVSIKLARVRRLEVRP